jgi:hypothetical protein
MVILSDNEATMFLPRLGRGLESKKNKPYKEVVKIMDLNDQYNGSGIVVIKCG